MVHQLCLAGRRPDRPQVAEHLLQHFLGIAAHQGVRSADDDGVVEQCPQAQSAVPSASTLALLHRPAAAHLGGGEMECVCY